MPLVIGHSQAKYLSETLSSENYSVFSYPGFRARDFLDIVDIFDVAPFFSTFVLIVGANDVNYETPTTIVNNILRLCEKFKDENTGATIILSEILPRAQNLFSGHQLSQQFIDRWNYNAAEVNNNLRALADKTSWLHIMSQPEFHTMFGARRNMLSRDGLHLSFEGTYTLCDNIERAVAGCIQVDRETTITASDLKPVIGSSDTTVTAPDLKPIIGSRDTTVIAIDLNPVIGSTDPPSTTTETSASTSFAVWQLVTSRRRGSRKSTTKKRKLTFEFEESGKKFPKLEMSIIKEELEISDERSADNLDISVDYWDQELKLTNEDIYVLNNGGKLNSAHMEAVNIILRNQFKNEIHSLQLTEKVPVFNESANKWNYALPMVSCNEPCVQIHHNHNDHWVCSFKVQNSIYLLDSLGNQRPDNKLIPNGLRIQLAKLYSNSDRKLLVHIPTVAKQTNSVDCGLYAVAFATQFCFYKNPVINVIFDSSQLRSHLLSCFVSKKMSLFPTTTKTISNRKKKFNEMHRNRNILYL